jgi:hypothetical protein
LSSVWLHVSKPGHVKISPVWLSRTGNNGIYSSFGGL